jgi:hypothetical protein
MSSQPAIRTARYGRCRACFRLESGGRIIEIATGEKNGPWTGVTFYKGFFYVAEGGELQGGRILRIAGDGTKTALVDNLPTRGDHHTNGSVIGPDGYLYFGQGTYTNSGVVGQDNAEFGWLKRFPNLHDIPCKDIRLNGRNFTTTHPLQPDSREEVLTGAFSPFGKPTSKHEVIRGQVPCSGSVLKLPLGGGSAELVAWGFRNPFGLAFRLTAISSSPTTATILAAAVRSTGQGIFFGR